MLPTVLVRKQAANFLTIHSCCVGFGLFGSLFSPCFLHFESLFTSTCKASYDLKNLQPDMISVFAAWCFPVSKFIISTLL